MVAAPDLCCPNCFDDAAIRSHLIDQVITSVGTCPRCDATVARRANPEDFYQWFSSLLSSYEEDETGERIEALLEAEWGMFANSPLSATERRVLIADVMGDPEILRRSFLPLGVTPSQSLEAWDYMVEEMMHARRWFSQSDLDLLRISRLLDRLVVSQSDLPDHEWTRGRILGPGGTFSAEDMGAPPKELAGNGRVSPAGIRCLYVASNPETAAAELRPHPGERIALSEVTLDAGLRFADLRDPRALVTPLLLEESDVKRVREDLPFLQRLGEELTKPVHPNVSLYRYAPTQFLCELIKSNGFDGVLYNSAMTTNDGINLAVFDPNNASVAHPRICTVGRVTVAFE